ncbi:MAG: ABC transporter permease [Alphaproteobacteria bacterium]|jgi:ABC-2 type transport system permease protein|nr:ABC transporter permease [Alphaproteobacteria bacterium]MDP6565218.1 ABC transporter permease [Alphaproteobacteria bacterium]
MLGLTTAHCRVILLDFFRSPSYWVPTVIFPAMLFSFFGASIAEHGVRASTLGTASFAVYAVIGIAFYQFGVGIAQERESPWEGYLRTLPAPALPRIAARIAAALIFAAMAAATVVAVAHVIADPSFGLGSGLALAGALALGLVPFALLGVALGYLASAKAAVALANVIYLPLAFAGGLWLPPQGLPEAIAALSPLTPTRQFAELVWAATMAKPPPVSSLLGLVAYTLAFGGLAVWAYRRDQGTRFR